MLRFISKVFATLFALTFVMVIAVAGGAIFVFYKYGRDLPAYAQLADYKPPTMTRVHAGDGRLLTEYAEQPRVFVPVSAVPQLVINAFLAAEDKNFYTHPGVDIVATVRVAVTNVRDMGKGLRPKGASTISQQVAKNFLLTNEVSYIRKIQEAILAVRIEKALGKDRVLELYLNEIYLGYGSYGVAAAALNYFNKPLGELTIAEAAYLAALPKGPTNYHPIRRPEAAKGRRDWVVSRMLEEGFITAAAASAAQASPFEIRPREATDIVIAEYFAEEVRRELVDRFGTDQLYGGGLSVRTTLDPRMQEIANRVFRQGLESYDRRHGWRGPIANIEFPGFQWEQRLGEIPRPKGLTDHLMAVVITLGIDRAEIGLADGGTGFIPMAELEWARPWRENQRVGPAPKSPGDVLAEGDVVAVLPLDDTEDGFRLHQIPNIEGALVALDPHTGRVLAMVGGYSFAVSEFNRATQARRQPGSAFKPIVYLAAMENGFTPASLVLDAPFVIDQGPGLGKWKPANYTNKFYGPSTLRLGMEKSRNLMTVRLAQYIGIETVATFAERLHVIDDMPEILSMALGAGETSLMRLTTAYAMLVNGGREITPTLIDRIQDRRGQTVFRHDDRPCTNCANVAWGQAGAPTAPDTRAQLVSPAAAYQVVSMMEGVVQRGTGRSIRSVGKPLAGKTGTTNDAFDTWFLGFSPDLAVGVYVGFDSPRTLGPSEQGASAAAPIFRDFMDEALQGTPAIPFRIPPGIQLVRINAETGTLAAFGDEQVILEAFRPGTAPQGEALVLDFGMIALDEAMRRGLY
ncbi:MAG: penicillin-binding protein 1A [Alphaproteobacteria bacterium]|jgi:penicillin-binding protein 1A|nr:penicillin-binding protein 1A [Alphaproteobacteria bacterium]